MAMEVAHEEVNTPSVPFAECGAMSQGYIGYHLQQSIQEELVKRNMRKNCVTVLTQVVVDKKDKAFQNPTKPVGSFYTEEEAKKMELERGYVFKEDAGRGYRRVVPSPEPQQIVESKTIKMLLENNNIVIAGGGGGIPVVYHYNKLKGVDAVIDKDKTSAKIATALKIDIHQLFTPYYAESEQMNILYTTISKKIISDIRTSVNELLDSMETSGTEQTRID